VLLVRDQFVPGARDEEGLHMGHLDRPGRVELAFPAGLERPGEAVAVQLARRSTAEVLSCSNS
jgi:hypothetical protein